MRLLWIATLVALVAGCGRASSVHYDRAAAITCLRETNSLSPVPGPDRVLVVFGGPNIPDAATEAVAVGFGSGTSEARERADSLAATPLGKALGIAHFRKRTIERGDAYAYGTGAFEPAIARRTGISDADAASEIKRLEATVKPTVESCLKKNER